MGLVIAPSASRVLAAVACAAALAGVSVDAARADLTGPETLFLDSFSATERGTSVVTSDVLAAGTYYTVVVSGTFTKYGPGSWSHGEPCGAADPSPSNPSPGRPVTPAGVDAEFMFGRPKLDGCFTLPRPYGGFQLDVGTGLKYVDPTTGVPAQPAEDHTYTYAVRGAGQPARFVISDSNSSDNNGILTIRIRPAVRSDCGNSAECAETAPDAPPPAEPPAAVLPPAPIETTRALPSTRVCVSRRRFKIHVISPRRKPLAAVAVTVDGKGTKVRRTRKRKHKYFVAVVDLRGKPKGRFVVRIVTRDRQGRLGEAKRRYRTCWGWPHPKRRRPR